MLLFSSSFRSSFFSISKLMFTVLRGFFSCLFLMNVFWPICPYPIICLMFCCFLLSSFMFLCTLKFYGELFWPLFVLITAFYTWNPEIVLLFFDLAVIKPKFCLFYGLLIFKLLIIALCKLILLMGVLCSNPPLSL